MRKNEIQYVNIHLHYNGLPVSGWSLGEHQEWSKYSNFEVSVRVPLMVYVPGTTHSKQVRGETFPYIQPSRKKATKTVESDKQQTWNAIHKGIHGSNRKFDPSTSNLGVSIMDQQKWQTHGYYSNALVELVDLFPTLVDLVGLESIPLCPQQSSPVIDTCTEGFSFAKLIKDLTDTEKSVLHNRLWKNATFSQYPRPSLTPQENSDKPRLKDINIMGYSMRTQTLRYTEWVGFDPEHFCGNWSDVQARELYFHESDPLEDTNLAMKTQYANLVKQLSEFLHRGWRHALPKGL